MQFHAKNKKIGVAEKPSPFPFVSPKRKDLHGQLKKKMGVVMVNYNPLQ